QEHLARRMLKLVDLSSHLPLPSTLRFKHSLRELDDLVYQLIDERQRADSDAPDLLSALLAARDPETGAAMTTRQVRDEAMTSLLAAHETTANALAWTWHLLSIHPDWIERLQVEIATAIGERLPTIADMKALPTTRAVLEEALRLYPPAWVIARFVLKESRI